MNGEQIAENKLRIKINSLMPLINKMNGEEKKKFISLCENLLKTKNVVDLKTEFNNFMNTINTQRQVVL